MKFLCCIVPCYNVSKYINKFLDSIFCSKFSDLQLIFVDDGSEDNLLDEFSTYFKIQFPNRNTFVEILTYKGVDIIFIKKINGGISSARNFGLKFVNAKYIVFLDPDDYIDNNYFRYTEGILNDKEFDILIFSFYKHIVDNNGNIKETNVINSLIDKEFDNNYQCVSELLPLYLGYSCNNLEKYDKGIPLSVQLQWGSVWRCVYRYEILVNNKITFNEKLSLNEDTIFNLYCILYSDKIKIINKPFYHYMLKPFGLLNSTLSDKNIGKRVNIKIILFKERLNIINRVNSKYRNLLSYENIAGTVFLSSIQLMSICDKISQYKYIRTYICDKTVEHIIKNISIRMRNLKIRIPLFMMKHSLTYILFMLIVFAKKMNVKINI